jgi:hypothetical protein
MSDAVVTAEKGISDLLAQVVEQRFQVEKVNAELKAAKSKLADMERKAAAMLEAAGVDGIKCHGATWWAGIDLHVSAVQGDREKLLEAAKKVNLDVVQVSTSRIKGWLLEEYERRRDEGTAGEKFAEGTVFDGLVSEYCEKKLHRRAV